MSRYTYVRVGARGTEGVWAAVPRTTLKAGARIRVKDAIEMRDFKSESLHRTFDSVYFGVLEGAPAAPSP